MMKKITVLAATTALTAAIAIPAWSIAQRPADPAGHALAALEDELRELRLLLASADDDDDTHHRRGHDDDDTRFAGHEDGGEDRDDDDDCRGTVCRGGGNPAPAGTVAPPQNGLFAPGAAPKAQVN